MLLDDDNIIIPLNQPQHANLPDEDNANPNQPTPPNSPMTSSSDSDTQNFGENKTEQEYATPEQSITLPRWPMNAHTHLVHCQEQSQKEKTTPYSVFHLDELRKATKKKEKEETRVENDQQHKNSVSFLKHFSCKNSLYSVI